MLQILNYANIDFQEYKIRDKDYYIFQSVSGVNIYFDLEDGVLYRIGKMDDSVIL